MLEKLKQKGDNTAVEFGGWRDSFVNLNFPADLGMRFFISIHYYSDGYAYADLTDLSNNKKYISTINAAGKTEFDNWVQL